MIITQRLYVDFNHLSNLILYESTHYRNHYLPTGKGEIYQLERARKHYALENSRKINKNKYGYLLFPLKKKMKINFSVDVDF